MARMLQPQSISFCALQGRPDRQVFTMAKYKILSWRDIPTQIKVEDEFDEVTAMLDDRFMALIDAEAMKLGLQDTDSFLAQWQWSDEQEREGTADEVAGALKAELEVKYR